VTPVTPAARQQTARRMRLRAIGGIVFILALFAIALGGTFSLTSFALQRAGQQPPLLLVQVVDGVLALVLLGMSLAGVGFVVAAVSGRRRRRGDAGPLGQIIEALGRIAKGDFGVRLDERLQDNAMVGDLASSVNQMAIELGQLEEMRQEFIANVSHEIQSPLTSIRGFAQALQRDDLSAEERRHYLAIIETESTRLSRLTADLLKLAALDSERATFHPKPYRLDKQIGNAVLASEPLWAGKELDMEVSLEEVSVTGDEDLLSEVWLNLLHNSIKFTPEAGHIGVSLRQEDGRIAVEVRDTGIGIPEEDQPRVFERFYKADKARDRALGGSGLGLAIAKRILELHQGTIGLESVPGSGTTVRVMLPRGR
jgi:two-component system phosphate regulon sensor histidine kinase PhoR